MRRTLTLDVIGNGADRVGSGLVELIDGDLKVNIKEFLLGIVICKRKQL